MFAFMEWTRHSKRSSLWSNDNGNGSSGLFKALHSILQIICFEIQLWRRFNGRLYYITRVKISAIFRKVLQNKRQWPSHGRSLQTNIQNENRRDDRVLACPFACPPPIYKTQTTEVKWDHIYPRWNYMHAFWMNWSEITHIMEVEHNVCSVQPDDPHEPSDGRLTVKMLIVEPAK